jgi:hypothetical protein
MGIRLDRNNNRDLYSRRCRLSPTLSGIEKGEQRRITLSVNDLQISCRTS